MKNCLRKNVVAFSVIFAGIFSLHSADVEVDGESFIIFQGENVNTSAGDRIGVKGISIPSGYYGIGVQGEGGYKGVEGRSLVNSNNGVGWRYGVYGRANYGSTNVGVYGYTSGTSGTNIGVYGSATTATNNRAGKFVGDVEITGDFPNPSDRKLKKNITAMKSSCLKMITQLQPREYEYKVEEYPKMNFSKKHQYGLIAQDVEQIIPTLVGKGRMLEMDEKQMDGQNQAEPEEYKTVNYMGLIPILVGAIKEQQAELDELRQEVKKLKGY